MGLKTKNLARILPVYDEVFPPATLQRLWKQAQPKAYRYKINPTQWPWVLLCAFMGRFPSSQEILNRYSKRLGTKAKATFSDFVANPVFLKFVSLMREHFETTMRAKVEQEGLVTAFDTMPLTLSARARSDAKKINHNTLGIGMAWQCETTPQVGACPFQMLHILQGGWSDTALMLSPQTQLSPRLTTRVFDRGFSSHRLIHKWLQIQHLHQELSHDDYDHFIVRVRTREVTHVRRAGCECVGRTIGTLTIKLDTIAVIGQQTPVRVRLVWAVLANGDNLILASSHFDWTAEQLLQTYHRRWMIERMHRLFKDTIGLAHLYSFQERGMAALTQLVMLLAGLLWVQFSREYVGQGYDLVRVIREGVKSLRRKLTKPEGTWKRNITQRRYTKKRASRRRKKLPNSVSQNDKTRVALV